MDSNHRPSGYEPDELPLLHAASCIFSMCLSFDSPSGRSVTYGGTSTAQLLVWMAHGPTLPASNPPVPSALLRFTTRFGMVRGGSTVLNARQWLRVFILLQPVSSLIIIFFTSRHVFLQGSPRPCAPVASTPHDASSAGRSPSYLLGGLPAYSCEYIHLGAHFPLRCFQRFLLPDLATEPAGCPTTPPPAVRPRRSSRTERSSPQCTKRP